MKRISKVLLFPVVAAALLTGCGSEDTSTAQPPATSAAGSGDCTQQGKFPPSPTMITSTAC
ncbi:hypothetical protein ACRS6B_00680 [Nocardia asteroides]